MGAPGGGRRALSAVARFARTETEIRDQLFACNRLRGLCAGSRLARKERSHAGRIFGGHLLGGKPEKQPAQLVDRLVMRTENGMGIREDLVRCRTSGVEPDRFANSPEPLRAVA